MSFVELEQFLAARGVEVEGDQEVVLAGNENVVVWSGVSKAFADEVNDLLRAGVRQQRTQVLVYAVDGKLLDLPIAAQPGRVYKSRRWLPVVFVVEQ